MVPEEPRAHEGGGGPSRIAGRGIRPARGSSQIDASIPWMPDLFDEVDLARDVVAVGDLRQMPSPVNLASMSVLVRMRLLGGSMWMPRMSSQRFSAGDDGGGREGGARVEDGVFERAPGDLGSSFAARAEA